MRVGFLSSLVLAALIVVPGADAQETTTTKPPPPTTTVPAPAPTQRVTSKLRITLERVNGKDRAVIAGNRFRVRGHVSIFVPGQRVTVRLYRRGKKVAARSVAIQREGSSNSGTFVVGFVARGNRRLTVQASHRRTDELDTMVAPRQRVSVLTQFATYGSSGLVVRLLQRQLKQRGYVVGVPGRYDGRTARAVAAFRKMTGMARTEVASPDVFRRLAGGAGYFKIRYPGHGHHVEADLTHQVLALINGKRVQRLYPISSGASVTPTILGSFRVYSKTPGTNQKGMVFSNYFIRGYAIHGYASVPPYPASHGCLRVPVPDAVPIYNWINYGDYVDTYYR